MIYGPDTPLYLRLYLTLRSKFDCPQSPVGASPDRTETMAAEDAEKYVSSVAEAQQVTWVDISGGEPFLYYDEMLRVLKYAKKKGIPGKVTSSAFWASDALKSAWIIAGLKEAGVEHLDICYDSLHAEHVLFERVKNAALAARQESLTLKVVSSYLDPESEAWSGKGPYEGGVSNETDRQTATIQRQLLDFLPKRCLGWQRVRLTGNADRLSGFLGDRFEEARLACERAMAQAENMNGRIDTAVVVSIMPNGELTINERLMGNAREKDAEMMVRDFIIESRMGF